MRYSVVDENDGNLAHNMVVSGLCDVMTSHSEWQKEVSDRELDWLLQHPMLTALPCLTFLPHPLPLFVGQWLQISVVGFYCLPAGDGDKGLEQETKRIGIHINSVHSELQLSDSMKIISSQVRIVNIVVILIIILFE